LCSLSTDAEGRFRVEGLLARDYTLRVMHPRTLATADFGPFRAGEREAEIVFRDEALGRIAGRVVGRDGRALAGVSIALLGHMYGGVWTGGGSALSDADGRFAFEDVGGTDLALSISSDEIVPSWTPVAAARGAPAPGGGNVELEITVAVRCHLQVDLGTDRARADAMRVLDAEGSALELFRIGPTGSYRNEQFPIVEGRSAPLSVDERASTLVLLKDGKEVQRVPLALRPGTLERITP
jgi:hypothetical protein